MLSVTSTEKNAVSFEVFSKCRAGFWICLELDFLPEQKMLFKHK